MLRSTRYAVTFSVQSRSFAKAASGKNVNLKEYQEKYRTSCSDILEALPVDGKMDSAQSDKIADLFTTYYEKLGAYTQVKAEERKLKSSKFYEELINYRNVKWSELKKPYYAVTHFPLLSEITGNNVVTEESYLQFLGDKLGIPDKERADFNDFMVLGTMRAPGQWQIDLQEKFQDMNDEVNDMHQDAIEWVENDFGENGLDNCDHTGFNPLFEPAAGQDLIELMKEYDMTAEEVENVTYLEEVEKLIRDDEIEQTPAGLPDIG